MKNLEWLLGLPPEEAITRLVERAVRLIPSEKRDALLVCANCAPMQCLEALVKVDGLGSWLVSEHTEEAE